MKKSKFSSDDITGSLSSMFKSFINEFTGDEDKLFTPVVDQLETAEAYYLELTAPGMKKESFTIDIDNGKLTIGGERRMKKEDGLLYNKVESEYGKFTRVFNLNKDVDEKAIRAKYEDGILIVKLPKLQGDDSKKSSVSID